MKNRGSVLTETIAEKLKKVEDDLGITSQASSTLENSPRVFINGHLNRKKYTYITKSFSLIEPLHKELKTICKGVDLTILNYLIYLGLQKIKENTELTSIEYSEFESNIKDSLK